MKMAKRGVVLSWALLTLALGCDDGANSANRPVEPHESICLTDQGTPDAATGEDAALDLDLGSPDAVADADLVDASPDMATDMATDMAAPTFCDDSGLSDGPLLRAVHRRMHDAYQPIEIDRDLSRNATRYMTARQMMFNEVEWIETGLGEGGVETLYTGLFYAFPPGELPSDGDVNCEHTWPRSKMNPDDDSRLFAHQEGDLHHLFPAESGVNATRGSLPFGDPVTDISEANLPALRGDNEHGERVFRPRDERRGDVARVTFYFAARWGMDIDGHQEEALRRWSAVDPPDAYERRRNEMFAARQGNRNPFIDCPGLEARINDFVRFEALDTEGTLP